MRVRLIVAALLVSFVGGCKGGEDSCSTTQDCSDQGKTLQKCVNGACIRVCELDQDCSGAELQCESGDTACEAENERLASSTFICEDLQCVSGCPTTACSDGETCFAGRCVVYSESFESMLPGGIVEPSFFGFNDIDRSLRNKRTKIVWSGLPSCGIETERDRCAGPAAHGDYYLAVERQPTSETGTAQLGATCQACQCCLECRDASTRTSTGSSCPGLVLPEATLCTAAVPSACQSICAECDSCSAELPDVVGAGLSVCEAQAAGRTCAACVTHDTCLRDKAAENRACPGPVGTYPACTTAPTNQSECDTCLIMECDDSRAACYYCRDVARLMRSRPNEPELWHELAMQCASQGNDGCVDGTKAYLRSGLTDDEQTIESPAIDLSATSGRLVLQFEFIPFNVGQTYTRVLQGVPRADWPTEAQMVSVQLCGAGCDASGGWIDATFINGEPAVLPENTQRSNGLQFGAQNRADWTTNLRSVEIPDSVKTSEFRFRLLPRLADDVRIGIDRIEIRRRP